MGIGILSTGNSLLSRLRGNNSEGKWESLKQREKANRPRGTQFSVIELKQEL